METTMNIGLLCMWLFGVLSVIFLLRSLDKIVDTLQDIKEELKKANQNISDIRFSDLSEIDRKLFDIRSK